MAGKDGNMFSYQCINDMPDRTDHFDRMNYKCFYLIWDFCIYIYLFTWLVLILDSRLAHRDCFPILSLSDLSDRFGGNLCIFFADDSFRSMRLGKNACRSRVER